MNRSTIGRVLAAVAVIVAAVGGLLSVPAAASGGTVPPVVRCADLVRSYPGVSTEVTAANEVTANGTTYCEVTGRVAPAVGFELKLPLTTYTGRYVQYGCDGLCGLVRDVAIPSCGSPGHDLAVGATNDGHASPLPGQELFDGRWAANDQAARNDYFYRAPHVVAQAAKRIIATFYGKAPKQSYFNGCSTGGREALLLAQRYPHDFDGIIAGAPVNYMGPLFGVYMPWILKANRDAAGKPILTIDKLPVLNGAVMAACDGLDGLVDGQLEDPRACTYDPVRLQCPPGTDLQSCLTPAQVTTVRKLYAGPTDAHGVRLYPGWQTRGSELAWVYSIVPGPNGEDFLSPLPDNYLKYVGYPIDKPHSSLAAVAFTQQELHRLTPEGVKGNALALDLSEFRRAGGKLILWHGWNDHAIPAVGTLNYYDRLVARNGGLTSTAAVDADVHGAGQAALRGPRRRPVRPAPRAAGLGGRRERAEEDRRDLVRPTGQRDSDATGLPVPAPGQVRRQRLDRRRQQLRPRPADEAHARPDRLGRHLPPRDPRARRPLTTP